MEKRVFITIYGDVKPNNVSNIYSAVVVFLH
jgi:hypothetical protein